MKTIPNTSIPTFEAWMDKIRQDTARRKAEQELQEVPLEVIAEMNVKSNWNNISDKVKEKIVNNEPF